MKKLVGFILMLCLFGVTIARADTYHPLAESLNEVIAGADIIVTGTLSLTGTSRFYGYNEDGSDATFDQRLREMPSLGAETLRRIGMPLVEYEVILSSSLKGDIKEKIILRVMIAPLSNHLNESMDRERMFFLTRNGNSGTYGTISFDSILEKSTQGEYKFANVTEDSATVTLEEIRYISPEDAGADVLEGLISERISLGL